ncbi:putative ribonuclease H-like domain-containing protein [Tanacetum coccineum]|uniref:Ribonuclease H-like domain-containing protein n=1 Tax=Tanacetum coccineum TaxID=301880 RepID=A0ABQ5FGV5_9ASTR
MYLTASRLDIMYAVCACSRFQVTPKVSYLYAVKRIFKYIKGKPKLGLWYPRESPLDLVAYSNSDYAAANLDRKSTTSGCQFLGRRLISWQCKKQTIMATSTTEAEYVAAVSCCGQVLWLQNQLLDYGFNFMNTIIHIDNQSTICIIKNPVYHSKTKHIEIRHHFIRDCYEKKLIQVQKIHTDLNVADLLTKAFDGPRFNFLLVNIGMLSIKSASRTLLLMAVPKDHLRRFHGMDDAKEIWLNLDMKKDMPPVTCQLDANWLFKYFSPNLSMAQLKYCDKHNQVGFLFKPAESAGYTEIVDFLRRSKLRYALTHNPPIYDSLVKQFWQTATARTLADGTQQLNATIDTIEYTITEESVRRQLQLADASGIHMLQNEEIFAGLQNIGYVNDRTFTFWKSHFTPQWRFLIHHILHCLSSKSGGWDQFGSNIAIALICLSTGRDFNFSKLIFDGMISNLKSKSKFLMYPRFLQMILNVQTENKNLFVPVLLTKKIFGNMKRGFQGIHRPLLPVMLTIDAGQPQPSADPTPSQSIPATSLSHVQIPQPPPTATHSVQPPPQPSSVQPTAITPPTQPVQTTSPPPVSSIPDIQPTQPPSPQIPSPSFHDTEGPSFEPSYHMSPPPSHEPEIQASISSEESEQLRNLMDIVPRLESRVKSLEKELSETKQTLGTAILQLIEKVKKLENKLKKKRKSKETKDAEDQDQEVPFETDQGDTFVTPEKSKGSGEAQEEQISPTTLEAAQILTIVASEGFKGSQAPLGSKIYKDKSSLQKLILYSHFEEPDSAQVNTAQVNTAELNPDSTPSAQINTGEVNAAEVNTGEAERVQRRKGKEPMTEEDLQAEVQASKTSKELQELADLEEAKRVQAKMDAETQRQIDLDALQLEVDQILAEKIQQEEREQYSIEERAKFLHDTIAAQRKFLAEQRSAVIRNKPPTISQLRNQMITYLKHVANKKHAELKSKSFEESSKDERAIKKMNEKDADKEEEKKDESVHEEVQEEEGAKKRKLGTRRKLKAKRRKHGSSLTREDDDLKICLHIAPDEDKVIDAESLDHQYPIIEWQSFFLTTKPQSDQTKPNEDIYLNKVTRSNGHQRFFRTLMGVLSILDREDLKVIYELVMEEYKDTLPEGFDRMLWGDLMIMFNQGDTAVFWDTQQDWKLISWKLHSSSGYSIILCVLCIFTPCMNAAVTRTKIIKIYLLRSRRRLAQDVNECRLASSALTSTINESTRHGLLESSRVDVCNSYSLLLMSFDSECISHSVDLNCRIDLRSILSEFTEIYAVGTVKFGNDQIAPILGYGDLVQGTITIKRVYYVEGLNHNLFSVGQFCDADLEVAFRKSTCYIRDLKGNDLLTGKAKRKSFHTKTNPSSKRRLQLLHMDLCGPMRVERINGKKYVLVIVDDYSRYTWTHFLRSKENPRFSHDFITLVPKRHFMPQGFNSFETEKAIDFLINIFMHNLQKRDKTRETSILLRFHTEPNGVMASDHASSDTGPQCSTTVLEQDSLSPGPQCPENVPQVVETASLYTTSNGAGIAL